MVVCVIVIVVVAVAGAVAMAVGHIVAGNSDDISLTVGAVAHMSFRGGNRERKAERDGKSPLHALFG